MENGDKITTHQLMVMIFLSLLSPLIRILPRFSVSFAGHTAWLSAIPAAIFGVLYLCFISHFFKYSEQGDSLYTIGMKSLGKIGGTIFAVLCVLWLLFYAGFITRSAAERLLASVYQEGRPPAFIIITIFVAIVSASGTTKALVRTGEVLLPIIGLVLTFIILASIKDVKTEYLLPVTYRDTGKILLGSVPIIDIIGAQAYFMFLAGGVTDRELIKKKSVKWLIINMICVFAIMIVTVGFCAPELTLKFHNAFFMVIRNISVFGIIERIEALIIAVWILTDFMLISSLLMIIGELMKNIIKSAKRRPFVIVSGIITAIIALYIASNAFTLLIYSDFFVPAVNMVFTFVIIPAVLITGLIRGKAGRKNLR